MSLKLQVDEQLKSPGAILKLQLGCGHNILPGWINTDSEPAPLANYLDFRRPFPFSANLFNAVFCEHTIEHVTKDEGRGMLAEVFRVLKPGGLFRVVTPSLDKMFKMMLDPGAPQSQQYLNWFRGYVKNPQATLTDSINLAFYGHGHRYLYTNDELVSALHAAGFRSLAMMPGGTYRDSIFNEVDGHGRIVGDAINALETVAVECIKPADASTPGPSSINSTNS